MNLEQATLVMQEVLERYQYQNLPIDLGAAARGLQRDCVDLDVADVRAAFDYLIRESRSEFPPTVGQVRERIRLVRAFARIWDHQTAIGMGR